MSGGGVHIAPLEPHHQAQWLPLWAANNAVSPLPADVTKTTWERLTDPFYPLCGFGAHFEGRMVGILHYALHPTTGSLGPAGYMQDVFVDSAYRRRGVAKAMLARLLEEARTQNWARILWLVDRGNAPARKLYEGFGMALDFTPYVLVP